MKLTRYNCRIMSSGTELISDLDSWSSDDFSVRWMNILPRIVSEVRSAASSKIAEYVRVLFTSVVPCIPLIELEKSAFSQVCDTISFEFSRRLDSLKDQVLNAKESVTVENCAGAVFEGCFEILDSAAICIDYFIGTTIHPSLRDVRSLCRCVLTIIQYSYTHCKMSYSTYGDWFNLVAENLSSLYQRAFTLQKTFLRLVDKLTSSNDVAVDQEEPEDVCFLIERMTTLADTVTELDGKASVGLWKSVSTLANRYRETIDRHLDISLVFISLASRMNSSCSNINQMTEEGANAGLKDDIKLLGFYMKVLVGVCRDYVEYLSGAECCHTIITLLTRIQRLLLRQVPCPSLTAHDSVALVDHRDEIRRYIGMGVEPLLACLLSNKHFISALLACSTDDGDSGYNMDDGYARLSLLSLVMTLLPQLSEEMRLCLLAPSSYNEDTPTHNLMSAVFFCIPHCYRELCYPITQPGLMLHGQRHREISLYEHTLIRLCAVAACFPNKQFHVMEKTLLENVLDESHHRAMLASDVWCFLARYGTAEVCRDHCRYIATLLLRLGILPTVQCCHLVALLRRLIRLLSEQHQTQLMSDLASTSVDAVDGSSVLDLFSQLSLSCLTPHSLAQAQDQLIPLCVAAVCDWLMNRESSSQALQQAISALNCLSNLLTPLSTNNPCTDLSQSLATHLTASVELCCKLLTTDTFSSLTQPHHHRLVVALVRLMSCLVPSVGYDAIARTLRLCYRLQLEGGADDLTQLAVLSFIGSIAPCSFTGTYEQEIMQLLPNICRQLIQSDNSVIHQMSLVLFSRVAEVTPHESIVVDTLSAGGEEGEVRQLAVEYINTMASGVYDQRVDVDIINSQWQAIKLAQRVVTLIIDDLTEDNIVEAAVEPATKRLKIKVEQDQKESCQDETVEQIRRSLADLTQHIDSLENLFNGSLSFTPRPQWFKDSLLDLTNRLNSLLGPS